MPMPPEVRGILIHELMHLKQANHSIRFWRCGSRLPGFREAERWLKKHGPSLVLAGSWKLES